MFERTLVDSTLDFNRRKSLVVLPLSAAAHFAALAAVIYVSALHVDMPTDPPARMQPFQIQLAPQVPVAPAPPRGNPATPAIPQTAAPRVAASPILTPATIPDAIPVPQVAAPSLQVGSAIGDPTAVGPIGVPTGRDDGTGTNPNATGGPGSTGDQLGDTPLPITGNVHAPVIVHRVDPRYPDLLLHIGMQGSAIVECIVDAHGVVQSVTPVSSSHKLFETAAVEAVRQWTFKPGTVDGRPVPTIFRLTVNFQPR